jgi:RAD50-interacting protein 1
MPQTTLVSLYRRIASHLSEHILKREITYRGRGRISQRDAKAIGAECELWVETCQAALSSRAGRNRVEAPWLKLLQAGRLLALDGQSWNNVIDETFSMGSDDALEECLLEVIGLCEMTRDEVTTIVRLREDCGR